MSASIKFCFSRFTAGN
ncbi:peptide IlvX [Citrobacter sp. RHB25-C09]